MSSDEQIEAMYYEHEKYILPTIYKKFPNYKTFSETHGLELDDLIQYGRIGLYKACKTFDSKKGLNMRSYVIQHIVWTIMTEVKKNSLNNVSNKSLHLLEKISLEQEFTIDGEAVFLHEAIGAVDEGYKEIEYTSMVELLKGRVPDKFLIALEMRKNGYTHSEIGEKLGVTPQRCNNLLRTYHKLLRDIMFE